MKAIKVFNNNSASVILPDGQEAVVVGSGIGFGKRPGDPLDTRRIEKVYCIQNELQTKFLQLLDNTRTEYLTAAEAILAKAQAENLSLRTHLKFLAGRIFSGQVWEDDDSDEMYRLLLKANRKNKECLQRLTDYIQENFRYTINQQEAVYLLIHCNKILQSKHKR